MDEPNLLDALAEVFGPENVVVIDEDTVFAESYVLRGPAVFAEEEDEPLDAQEWKLLFMLLCQNPGRLDFNTGLTPYGQQLLKSIQRKLGINVVGVDINAR